MSLWLLGGMDPTGGAGLLRDVWTAARVAPEVPLRCVVTAFTWQGHGRPAHASPVSVPCFRKLLERLPAPSAVKLGLVPDPLVDAVIDRLRSLAVPVVLDPVLAATDGGSLGASITGLARLAAVASLVTPNRDEVLALSRGEWTGDLGDHTGTGLGGVALLLKAVAGEQEETVCDYLIEAGAGSRPFRRPRQIGADPRGTGCALATAIACRLARGEVLHDAVAGAIGWLDDARTRTVPGPDGRPHLAGEFAP